uniref:Rh family B glycoprotein (gene/pseudogene) n=1 Tax=Nothoprocta perdicaria TaxID=30464 RepID=A0A8C6YU64_NOTPE
RPERALPAAVSGMCFLLQMLIIILFAVFVRYSPNGSPGLCSARLNCSSRRNPGPGSSHLRSWNVHLQTLMGFGFLMVFLGRYRMESAATCLLVTAFAIQWALLIQGFFYSFQNGKIYMETQSMVSAVFCAGAVLVSTGALLGWGNPLQLLLMSLLEVPLFSANEYVLLHLIGVSDGGGSLTVHTFGAYFGLALSWILRQDHAGKREQQQDTGHSPDVLAAADPCDLSPSCLSSLLSGTVCLWIFWPGFVSAAMVPASVEPWTELNTYVAMAASTLATFVMSPLLHKDGTPCMCQVQDATVAGAVVMGTAGEMLLAPFGALVAGFLAGLIPPLSSRFFPPVSPLIRTHTGDSCNRGHSVQTLPGCPPCGCVPSKHVPSSVCRLQLAFPHIADGSRTATYQALCQLCALPVTLLFAVLGGSVTGAILKIKGLGSPLATSCLENKTLQEVKWWFYQQNTQLSAQAAPPDGASWLDKGWVGKTASLKPPRSCWDRSLCPPQQW